MNERDNWKADLKWSVKMLIFLVAAFVLVGLLSSCSRKQVEFIETIDTLIITKTDTFKTEKVITQKEKEYVDRWRDRVVTVNPRGDTVKDVQQMVVYIEKEAYLRDSVAMYRAKCDSLRKVANRTKEKVIKEPPSIWDRFAQFLHAAIIGCFVGVLFTLTIKKNG